MKIRDGFISNSSSSSFIVALDKKPQNKDDIKQMFYRGFDKSLNCCSEKVVNTDVLSKIIWEDISRQKPTKSIKKLAEVIGKGSTIDCLEPDSDDYIDKKTLKGWDKYQIARDNYSEQIAKLFLNVNKKRFIYILEFSDNAGEIQSHLEHGDTFDEVKHLTICCH